MTVTVRVHESVHAAECPPKNVNMPAVSGAEGLPRAPLCAQWQERRVRASSAR